MKLLLTLKKEILLKFRGFSRYELSLWGRVLSFPVFGGLVENGVRVRPFPLEWGWVLMCCYPISFVDRVTGIADLHEFAMRAVWM